LKLRKQCSVIFENENTHPTVATIQRRINYLVEVMPGGRGAKALNM
jgi:hypothetical protein